MRTTLVLLCAIALCARASADEDLPAPEACVVKTVRAGWMSIECPSPPLRGARYAIHSQHPVRSYDPITGDPIRSPSNKLTGSIRLERISGNLGAGPVPRGTIVQVGDLAELSGAEVREELLAPRAWPGMTRLVVQLAPFVPVGELGIGFIGELQLEHRFWFPLVIGVRTSPVAMAFVRGGSGANGQVLAKVGYSSDYFELALEPGVQLDSRDPPRFALSYSLRLGALDGLSLRFSNSYVISGDAGNERFHFANAYAEVQVPIHRKAFLLFGGGGQLENSFWFKGYLGTRVFLRGSGGPGTVLFNAALGVAGVDVWQPADQNTDTTIGPMINAGIEYRF